MRKLTLPDGSIREFPENMTVYDIIGEISMGLRRNAVGALAGDKILGMEDVVKEDGDFRVLTFDDPEGKKVFWHTSAHLLALAVQRLFPGVKFGIGPAIDQGFYYDFDTEHRFTPEDLEKIEKEMVNISKEKHTVVRRVMDRDEAKEHFRGIGEKYKVDLIENFPEEEEISFYKMDTFDDLCRGPHLHDISMIKAIKLMSIAGAYWRGDEKNPMLQRIYGITFPKKSMLDEYLDRLEEAKKRDHRKLGRELDLFSIQEEGPGFPFFHPKGMVIQNEIINFWKEEHRKDGYGEVSTPSILSKHLWLQSGHWDHYKNNMYFTEIDDQEYAIKPMNCPGSILIYKSKLHSYRDFPFRWAELGHVHRHELSGALHGLMRVRSFTQDDAHLYMLPEHIEDEVWGVIKLIDRIYSVFGFKYTMELSTQPEDCMGTDEQWDIATKALEGALAKAGVEYKVNPGDGAFYGPKIDFHIEDAIGRTWQCATVQLDFQMPERFEMEYVDKDNERKRPVMVHRAIFGSLERFMGILIEHFAGKFPLWFSPVQMTVIPVSEKTNDYAEQVYKELMNAGFRAEIDLRDEKMGAKIREAQMQKINYMIVVGEQEKENGTISIRNRAGKSINGKLLKEAIEEFHEEIKTKRIGD
ncbi:MAG: threonine--tRNA ligase [Tissierellia bacterium]|nr:threonine--tRNA ligase [Tissierellia bacterium]